MGSKVGRDVSTISGTAVVANVGETVGMGSAVCSSGDLLLGRAESEGVGGRLRSVGRMVVNEGDGASVGDREDTLGCMLVSARTRPSVGTLVGVAERSSLGCCVGENVGGTVADLSRCTVSDTDVMISVAASVGELEVTTGIEVGDVDESCAVGASAFVPEVNAALDSVVGVFVAAEDGRKEGACVMVVPAEGEVRVGCGMLEDAVA